MEQNYVTVTLCIYADKSHRRLALSCLLMSNQHRCIVDSAYHNRVLISARPAVYVKKGKGSLYSITERRVPELIPVLGSQPAGDVSHNPGGRLSLLSARPAVTPATLKRAATNFAQRHNGCEQFCLRLLPDSVATAI